MMKTRLFLFFGWILLLLFFVNIAQAALGPVPSRTRAKPRLSVRYDPESGFRQIYYSDGFGEIVRLTEGTDDKSLPQWGPKGVEFDFYDADGEGSRACENGDLYYYLSGEPPALEMGCVASGDGGGTMAVSGYPLSGWEGAALSDVSTFHVATGEGLFYVTGGDVHDAYPVVVETTDGENVLVLHDDGVHPDETAYEDGFVFYDADVPGESEDWDGVITGYPEAGWDGTVRCPACVGENRPNGPASAPEQGGGTDDGNDADGDTNNEAVAEAANAADIETDASATNSSASDTAVESSANNTVGGTTITITNEVNISISSTAEGTESVQTTSVTQETPVVEPEPEVASDVSAPEEPAGAYEMSGDAIGSCALGTARKDLGNRSAFICCLLTLGFILGARHGRVIIGWKRVIKTVFGLCLLFYSFGLHSANAASKQHSSRKIAIVPVGENASTLVSLAKNLRHRLRGKGNVLPVESVLQALAGNENQSVEVLEAIRRVDAVLDSYYAYHADAAATRRDLAAAVAKMRAGLPPSPEASRLLLGSTVTLAWLDFKNGNRAEAGRTLMEVLNASPRGDLGLDAYPGAFHTFVEKARSHRETGTAGTLIASSRPEAVNVYVDGYLVGVTPLRKEFAAGSYRVSFEAPGRSPVTREVVLDGAKSLDIRVRLPWLKRADLRRGSLNTADWRKLGAAGRAAVAAQVARLTQADQLILLTEEKEKGNGIVTATAYDARYGQLMKEIQYGELIATLDGRENEVAAEFAEKLVVALRRENALPPKRVLERELVVDHRVARYDERAFYRKPAFWAAVGGVAAVGVIAGVIASQGGSSAGPRTGGIVVGF